MANQPEFDNQVKPSVGLIIVTRESKKSPLVAVLRRRGEIKLSKSEWKKESWAGAYQATAHSRLKGLESHTDTLLRKVHDQLGSLFFNFTRIADREMIPLFNDTERKVKTYGLSVHPRSLNHISLGPTSAGIKLFPLDEVDRIRELRQEDRDVIITDSNDIAMFSDEILALRNIALNRQLLAFLEKRI